MNYNKSRLRKLEFLIKESYLLANQEHPGTNGYHQAWSVYLSYLQEYRLLHSHTETATLFSEYPSISAIRGGDGGYITRTVSPRSIRRQQIKPEPVRNGAPNAMNENQDPSIRDKRVGDDKIHYILKFVKKAIPLSLAAVFLIGCSAVDKHYFRTLPLEFYHNLIGEQDENR